MIARSAPERNDMHGCAAIAGSEGVQEGLVQTNELIPPA